MIAHQMRRLRFAFDLAAERLTGQKPDCPYCGAVTSKLVGRKFILLEVRGCASCGLMFRYPKTSSSEANTYYQARYADFEQGLVTHLPRTEDLSRMREGDFSGTVWDTTARLAIIRSLAPPPGRILDFGCSWGYSILQASRMGYDAFGFEPSRARAEFGRSVLGASILGTYDELDDLGAEAVDVVYASHVLEHSTEPARDLDFFSRALRLGGWLVVLAPNCGGRSAAKMGVKWGPFSNEAHTLSLSGPFFDAALQSRGFHVWCFSDPYSLPLNLTNLPTVKFTPRLEGDELLVVAQKVQTVHQLHG